MTILEKLQETVGSLTASVGPSVVGVSGRGASGSGFVIGPARVLTNAHNVWGDRSAITFEDGRSKEGRALGIDVEGDLAVIEVGTGDAPALDLDGTVTAEIGAAVFGVGNPGGRGLRVTFGLISGIERSFRGPRGRRIDGSLEHTAPLLPGSSGSPVVDASGRLLGVNTHRLGEGFYLAIPADDAFRARVAALAAGESPKSVRLGVALAPSHVARRLRQAVGLPEAEGLLVRGVEEGSPADLAGLVQGDLLTAAGERLLDSVDDLFEVLDGSALQLTVLRGAEQITVPVEFED